MMLIETVTLYQAECFFIVLKNLKEIITEESIRSIAIKQNIEDLGNAIYVDWKVARINFRKEIEFKINPSSFYLLQQAFVDNDFPQTSEFIIANQAILEPIERKLINFIQT